MDLSWLLWLDREIALFVAFWLTLIWLDDLALDLIWLGLLVGGKGRSRPLPQGFANRPLRRPLAVFIPAWREARVIGDTIRHAREVWTQRDWRLYVGCYANDPATIAAARLAADHDRRVRVVVQSQFGPTTKAACLNSLYRALLTDEAAESVGVRAVVLHDAEDMVHPAELAVFDQALDQADFVQLPVRAEPLATSRWIAGHYLDEFAEGHGKAMVVRDALRAGLPGAGVGCAISIVVLAELETQLAACRPGGGAATAGPFAADSLTEDYELGWRVAAAGRPVRFLRLRGADGTLVATRAHFPDQLGASVRQKTRWTHGIACQAWDRLGWRGGVMARWMALRDRRTPWVAVITLATYLALLSGLIRLMIDGGPGPIAEAPTSLHRLLAWTAGAGLVWRSGMRVLLTGREYGVAEGLRAVPRSTVANLIAVLSSYRALRDYIRSLAGESPVWDKTDHVWHPCHGKAGQSPLVGER